MIRDITLGQYFPGHSLLHRLDPRAKIVMTVLYITALFLASTIFSYLVMGVGTFALIFLSGVPFRFYFKGLRPLLLIMCFTGILNMFYTNGDRVLFSFWVFTVTLEGVITAIFMVARIMLMVMSMSILTYTTSPLLLTGGLERLLSPLKKIRFPVHEFSMMMSTALRFIPTLLDETEKIMNAQKARGADFQSGNLFRRAKAMLPILIPLFVSAFQRAEELAVAMECRCYTGDSKGRTRYVRYQMEARDYVALVCCAALIGLILGLNQLQLWGHV